MKAPRLSHVWDRHPDDWYVEPHWVSKRLFERHKFSGLICDPACGMGNIISSARAMGYETRACDIARRSTLFEPEIRDWIAPDAVVVDNVVSNPPFKLCDASSNYAFVTRCLQRAEDQVALLLPTNWICGSKRARWLQDTPLEFVYFITPRPSMPPGTVIEAGEEPGNGTKDFAWFVWRQEYVGEPTVRWLNRG